MRKANHGFKHRGTAILLLLKMNKIISEKKLNMQRIVKRFDNSFNGSLSQKLFEEMIVQTFKQKLNGDERYELEKLYQNPSSINIEIKYPIMLKDLKETEKIESLKIKFISSIKQQSQSKRLSVDHFIKSIANQRMNSLEFNQVGQIFDSSNIKNTELRCRALICYLNQNDNIDTVDTSLLLNLIQYTNIPSSGEHQRENEVSENASKNDNELEILNKQFGEKITEVSNDILKKLEELRFQSIFQYGQKNYNVTMNGDIDLADFKTMMRAIKADITLGQLKVMEEKFKNTSRQINREVVSLRMFDEHLVKFKRAMEDLNTQNLFRDKIKLDLIKYLKNESDNRRMNISELFIQADTKKTGLVEKKLFFDLLLQNRIIFDKKIKYQISQFYLTKNCINYSQLQIDIDSFQPERGFQNAPSYRSMNSIQENQKDDYMILAEYISKNYPKINDCIKDFSSLVSNKIKKKELHMFFQKAIGKEISKPNFKDMIKELGFTKSGDIHKFEMTSCFKRIIKPIIMKWIGNLIKNCENNKIGFGLLLTEKKLFKGKSKVPSLNFQNFVVRYIGITVNEFKIMMNLLEINPDFQNNFKWGDIKSKLYDFIKRNNLRSDTFLSSFFSLDSKDKQGSNSAALYLMGMFRYKKRILNVQKAIQVFDEVDTDYSGSISFEEFEQIITNEMTNSDQDTIRSAFQILQNRQIKKGPEIDRIEFIKLILDDVKMENKEDVLYEESHWAKQIFIDIIQYFKDNKIKLLDEIKSYGAKITVSDLSQKVETSYKININDYPSLEDREIKEIVDIFALGSDGNLIIGSDFGNVLKRYEEKVKKGLAFSRKNTFKNLQSMSKLENTSDEIFSLIQNIKSRVIEREYKVYSIFATLDKDFNKSLDKKEFQYFLSSFYPKITKSQSIKIFEIVDENDSNKISIKEFVKYFGVKDVEKKQKEFESFRSGRTKNFDSIFTEITNCLNKNHKTKHFFLGNSKSTLMSGPLFESKLKQIGYNQQRNPEYQSFLEFLNKTVDFKKYIDLDKFQYFLNKIYDQLFSYTGNQNQNNNKIDTKLYALLMRILEAYNYSIEAIINSFDGDGNGDITRGEFLINCSKVIRNLSMNEIKNAYGDLMKLQNGSSSRSSIDTTFFRDTLNNIDDLNASADGQDKKLSNSQFYYKSSDALFDSFEEFDERSINDEDYSEQGKYKKMNSYGKKPLTESIVFSNESGFLQKNQNLILNKILSSIHSDKKILFDILSTKADYNNMIPTRSISDSLNTNSRINILPKEIDLMCANLEKYDDKVYVADFINKIFPNTNFNNKKSEVRVRNVEDIISQIISVMRLRKSTLNDILLDMKGMNRNHQTQYVYGQNFNHKNDVSLDINDFKRGCSRVLELQVPERILFRIFNSIKDLNSDKVTPNSLRSQLILCKQLKPETVLNDITIQLKNRNLTPRDIFKSERTLKINDLKRVMETLNIRCNTVEFEILIGQLDKDGTDSIELNEITVLFDESFKQNKAINDFRRLLYLKLNENNRMAMADLFHQFDTSGHGILNRVQFQRLVKFLSKNTEKNEIMLDDNLFSLIDADNDYLISLNELERIYDQNSINLLFSFISEFQWSLNSLLIKKGMKLIDLIKTIIPTFNENLSIDEFKRFAQQIFNSSEQGTQKNVDNEKLDNLYSIIDSKKNNQIDSHELTYFLLNGGNIDIIRLIYQLREIINARRIRADLLFKQIDSDNSNTVDLKEHINLIGNFGIQTSIIEVIELFSFLDKNNQNFINLPSFMEAFDTMNNFNPVHFNSFYFTNEIKDQYQMDYYNTNYAQLFAVNIVQNNQYQNPAGNNRQDYNNGNVYEKGNAIGGGQNRFNYQKQEAQESINKAIPMNLDQKIYMWEKIGENDRSMNTVKEVTKEIDLLCGSNHKSIDDILNHFDRDNNLRIDQNELRTFIMSFCQRMTINDRELNDVYQLIDCEKKGFINKVDLKQIIEFQFNKIHKTKRMKEQLVNDLERNAREYNIDPKNEFFRATNGKQDMNLNQFQSFIHNQKQLQIDFNSSDIREIYQSFFEGEGHSNRRGLNQKISYPLFNKILYPSQNSDNNFNTYSRMNPDQKINFENESLPATEYKSPYNNDLSNTKPTRMSKSNSRYEQPPGYITELVIKVYDNLRSSNIKSKTQFQQILDSNGSGRVSSYNFIEACGIHRLTKSQREANELYKYYEDKNNGFLELEKFINDVFYLRDDLPLQNTHSNVRNEHHRGPSSVQIEDILTDLRAVYINKCRYERTNPFKYFDRFCQVNTDFLKIEDFNKAVEELIERRISRENLSILFQKFDMHQNNRISKIEFCKSILKDSYPSKLIEYSLPCQGILQSYSNLLNSEKQNLFDLLQTNKDKISVNELTSLTFDLTRNRNMLQSRDTLLLTQLFGTPFIDLNLFNDAVKLVNKSYQNDPSSYKKENKYNRSYNNRSGNNSSLSNHLTPVFEQSEGVSGMAGRNNYKYGQKDNFNNYQDRNRDRNNRHESNEELNNIIKDKVLKNVINFMEQDRLTFSSLFYKYDQHNSGFISTDNFR